tara:strand:+ start:408 stop:530 length:123 start_codon:yes stop_codon:yes gene_type:complete
MTIEKAKKIVELIDYCDDNHIETKEEEEANNVLIKYYLEQ